MARSSPTSASTTEAGSGSCQFHPNGHVVGRLLPAAGELVDAGSVEAVGRLRRHQDMVDADAMVLLPGAGLVVPEGVDAGLRVAGAHRVGEAQVDERTERGPGLGL